MWIDIEENLSLNKQQCIVFIEIIKTVSWKTSRSAGGGLEYPDYTSYWGLIPHPKGYPEYDIWISAFDGDILVIWEVTITPMSTLNPEMSYLLESYL